jgi:translation initiation factor 1A
MPEQRLSHFGHRSVREVGAAGRIRDIWPSSANPITLKYAQAITIREAGCPLPFRRREPEEELKIGPDGFPEYVRVRLPRKKENEIFGIADQLLGASRIRVMCADGKHRMGRIPGKIKKRMWIREGDLLIVKPWDFQDEKANIMYRYTKTQSMYLSRKQMLPKSIDIF